MDTLRTIALLCVSEGVPFRSLMVAIVIGTLLNIINQYGAIRSLLIRQQPPVPFKWPAVALTYCVPYLVATYGAVSMRMTML